MDAQKTLDAKTKRARSKNALARRELVFELLRGAALFVLALLLGTAPMLFDCVPLAFSLLAAATRLAPFIWLGVALSSFSGASFSPAILLGACLTLALRLISRLFLDKRDKAFAKQGNFLNVLAVLFTEHPYLRMTSGAIGVFLVGIWRIVEGGFRFYDLFAAIFYLILTPIGAIIFSKSFDVGERKRIEGASFSMNAREEIFYDLSRLAIACAFIFSLGDISLAGISLPLFISVFLTLYACKGGALRGVITGLALGMALSPAQAPMLAFCAVAYTFTAKLSLFGAAVASCIAGLIWTIYVGGAAALLSSFPALLCATMSFCTAERINLFDDIKRALKSEKSASAELCASTVVAEQRALFTDERLRSISDSFSSLSEVFYNLSSKLKRPSMLDLRSICEQSFERACVGCPERELCYGAEYACTLEAMKKMTVSLYSSGAADQKKLPEDFKKRCGSIDEIACEMDRLCAIETKKAFQNEKTEIFALDYDAISKILNDAIAQNEDEFKIDSQMSKKIARAIADEGYGEHSVSVFGRRKLKIIARGLDLCDKAGDVGSLKRKLEAVAGVKLSDPTFELAQGSVNMQTEARRAYSCESGFAVSSSRGESVCGDSVSIFENRDGYLYALISDGMGTGRAAALTSETCNAFLRNMLTAGNRMETSLRMLNSVLRAKGSKSENECSATIDLLQLDLYSGALSLVKSGAAPTFIIRRENVFKLASPSFPIGILRALDAKQIDVTCEDGDIAIMVSDGAMCGGDDCAYLSSMLREKNLASDSAKAIAEKILRRARAETDPQNDDISVIVVKIKKELCNWD